MLEITTKLSKVNMERNLHSDHVSQKQTIKKQFKYVPFNTHECTDQLNSLQDSSQ